MPFAAPHIKFCLGEAKKSRSANSQYSAWAAAIISQASVHGNAT